MDLSAPIHLLGVRYDSLENLIRDIQLHASTQGYAVCRRIKKSLCTGLLEICYLCVCTSLRVYVPCVCMSPVYVP